jgi:hypothetical protein
MERQPGIASKDEGCNLGWHALGLGMKKEGEGIAAKDAIEEGGEVVDVETLIRRQPLNGFRVLRFTPLVTKSDDRYGRTECQRCV